MRTTKEIRSLSLSLSGFSLSKSNNRFWGQARQRLERFHFQCDFYGKPELMRRFVFVQLLITGVLIFVIRSARVKLRE